MTDVSGLKGVILAGGLGKRLEPLTRITNKHLLPIYNKPMVYYPLETLVEAGIKDIMIVTGGNNAGDFLRLIGNGQGIRPPAHQLHLPEGRRRNCRGPEAGRTLC